MSRFAAQLETAYRKGWDSAVVYRQPADNPYRRDDFRRRWAIGFRDCEGTAVNTRPGYTHFDQASAAHAVARVKAR